MARVHSSLSQLVGVHLAQTLIPLNRLLIPLTFSSEPVKQLMQFPLRVGIHHLIRFAPVNNLHPVQRRHGGIHTPVLNERAHIPVKQGQQQGADVRPVHVSIGHHNYLAVAGCLKVEGSPGTCTNHLDQRCAFGVGEHIRDRGALGVQDFTANRQQRLV